MLLSEGHDSFQMSEELMSQWDSAPLCKNVSRHFPVFWPLAPKVPSTLGAHGICQSSLCLHKCISDIGRMQVAFACTDSLVLLHC